MNNEERCVLIKQEQKRRYDFDVTMNLLPGWVESKQCAEENENRRLTGKDYFCTKCLSDHKGGFVCTRKEN